MISDDTMLQLKKLLMTEENYRQFPYRDSEGILTIGYGRNLESVGIRILEAQYLLESDIHVVMIELEQTIPVYNSCDDIRKLVLIDMAFNMGSAKLAGFQAMLECLRLGNLDGAAAEMLNSAWARQVGQRAVRLAQIMRMGKL